MVNLIIFRVYQILFFLIPLPIFFDLKSLSILNVDMVAYGAPIVPFPIRGLAFICIILLGFYLSFLEKFTKRQISNSYLVVHYCFMLPAFFIYAKFISDLELIRIVQISFPLIILGMISMPVRIHDIKFIFQLLLISVSLFVLLHFFSLLLTADDLLYINYKKEFPFVFGFFIYSSTSYYPAVLVLYVYLLLVYAFFVRSSYLIIIMVLVLSFVAFSAGRKITILEFTYLYSSLLIFYFYLIFKNGLKLSLFYNLFWFIFFMIIVFFIYFGSTGYQRLILEIDNLDSSRINIYLRALDLFTNNPKELLFGFGGHGRPRFHNFLLSQLFYIGIFGILIFYLIFCCFIQKFLSQKRQGLNRNQKFLLYILFALPMFQTLFNTSFLQPFYFLNFLVVFIIIYDYVLIKLKV
jgi:hypothetical protein